MVLLRMARGPRMRDTRMVGVAVAALTAAALVPWSVRAEDEPVDVVRLCTHRGEPTDAPIDPMVVTVRGSLPSRGSPQGNRYVDAEYVLRLQRGQHVILRLTGGLGDAGGLAVTSPSGRPLDPWAAKQSTPVAIADGIAGETGDYRIRVGNGHKLCESVHWVDWFKLSVTIEEAQTPSCTRAEHFDRYVGQDPSDFFRTEPGVRSRLRKLLKKDYREFMDRIQTTGPIHKRRGAVIVEGFRLHLSSIASRLAIKDGKFTAALVDDDKMRTFSEDPAHPFSF